MLSCHAELFNAALSAGAAPCGNGFQSLLCALPAREDVHVLADIAGFLGQLESLALSGWYGDGGLPVSEPLMQVISAFGLASAFQWVRTFLARWQCVDQLGKVSL